FPPDRVTLRVVRAPTVGPNGYVATNSVPLQRAAEYHYIINAQRQVTTGPTLGRRRPVGSDQQAIGSFRTLRTMVTVRIGTVRIINDSDDGGSGELAFTFTINGSYRFEAGTGLAEVSPGA